MKIPRYIVLSTSLVAAITVIVGCANPTGSNNNGGNGRDDTENGDSDGDDHGDGSNDDTLSAANVAFFRADAGREDIVAVMNDGTQQTVLFQLRADDLHVDGDNTMIYWLDAEHHKVQRAGSDGAVLESLITSTDSLQAARGFTIDTVNNTMYWIRVQDTENHLMRANMDGSTVEQLTTLSGDPRDVAVAGSTGYLFIGTGSDADAEVTRFNLDGTAPLTVAAAGDGARVAGALPSTGPQPRSLSQPD